MDPTIPTSNHVFASPPSSFELERALTSWQDYMVDTMPSSALHQHGTVGYAFCLLQTNPSVRKAAISLATSEALWKVVMDNEDVQELLTSAENPPDVAAETLLAIATENSALVLNEKSQDLATENSIPVDMNAEKSTLVSAENKRVAAENKKVEAKNSTVKISPNMKAGNLPHVAAKVVQKWIPKTQVQPQRMLQPESPMVDQWQKNWKMPACQKLRNKQTQQPDARQKLSFGNQSHHGDPQKVLRLEKQLLVSNNQAHKQAGNLFAISQGTSQSDAIEVLPEEEVAQNKKVIQASADLPNKNFGGLQFGSVPFKAPNDMTFSPCKTFLAPANHQEVVNELEELESVLVEGHGTAIAEGFDDLFIKEEEEESTATLTKPDEQMSNRVKPETENGADLNIVPQRQLKKLAIEKSKLMPTDISTQNPSIMTVEFSPTGRTENLPDTGSQNSPKAKGSTDTAAQSSAILAAQSSSNLAAKTSIDIANQKSVVLAAESSSGRAAKGSPDLAPEKQTSQTHKPIGGVEHVFRWIRRITEKVMEVVMKIQSIVDDVSQLLQREKHKETNSGKVQGKASGKCKETSCKEMESTVWGEHKAIGVEAGNNIYASALISILLILIVIVERANPQMGRVLNIITGAAFALQKVRSHVM